MDNRSLVNNTLFHPSMFEVTDNTPGDQRTIQSVRKQREKKIPETDLTKLVSPGSYRLTDGTTNTESFG
jgi:hypothetical protein